MTETLLLLLVNVICLISGFIAGYRVHGWEFDNELDDLEERLDRLEEHYDRV